MCGGLQAVSGHNKDGYRNCGYRCVEDFELCQRCVETIMMMVTIYGPVV